MKRLELHTSIEVYDQINQLSALDKELLIAAKEALKLAYAPYSEFSVGAALRLANGKIITGNNQENAAYPLCLCAERVALFNCSSQFPNAKIEALAISAASKHHVLKTPVTPCGSCRQVILESEFRQNQPIYVLMQGDVGSIYKINSIKDILPLSFDGTFLQS